MVSDFALEEASNSLGQPGAKIEWAWFRFSRSVAMASALASPSSKSHAQSQLFPRPPPASRSPAPTTSRSAGWERRGGLREVIRELLIVRFVLILADPEEQSSHIAMCDVRAATHAVGSKVLHAEEGPLMPSKGLNRLTWLLFFQKFEERKCLILMVKGTVLR
jgi:hypothetical protein